MHLNQQIMSPNRPNFKVTKTEFTLSLVPVIFLHKFGDNQPTSSRDIVEIERVKSD